MSAVERTAKYLRAHRRRWVSAIDLARVGGLLAWRSRVAELRFPPFNMAITWNGDKKASAYRYSGKKAA
jgi:hypothetical protein